MVRDWRAWHAQYDADGPLARRLVIVQRLIADFLVSRAGSPVAVLSMCSGDGRDLIGALAGLPERARKVSGRLVELDPLLVEQARLAVAKAGLPGLEVVQADAGNASAYVGAVPADLVLVCGVFGNIGDADVERTIRALPMLCTTDATIIWTRHRRPPDVTPSIRRWFAEAGFEEGGHYPVPDSAAAVGLHRFRGQPRALAPDVQLFRFARAARSDG